MASAISPVRSNILIYAGEGTNERSVFHLQQTLLSRFPTLLVSQVRTAYLNGAPWESTTLIFVMGGGVCSRWDKDFDPTLIARIHDFVVSGGCYLGICAGAYFSAEESSYTPHSGPVITKKRDLNLYAGTAKGPLEFHNRPPSPFTDPVPGVVTVETPRGERGLCYYAGGPQFIDNPMALSDVLASYSEDSSDTPAIVCQAVGKGRVILCGPHIEFPWKETPGSPRPTSPPTPQERELARIASLLYKYEDFRGSLWSDIVERVSSTTPRQQTDTPPDDDSKEDPELQAIYKRNA